MAQTGTDNLLRKIGTTRLSCSFSLRVHEAMLRCVHACSGLTPHEKPRYRVQMIGHTI